MSIINTHDSSSGYEGRNYSVTGGFKATVTIGAIGHSQNAVRLSCDAFFRFDDVTIPNAATIAAAYLELCPNGNDNGSPELIIHGIDEDDAAAPTSAAEFSADPHTTANVQWDTAWVASVWEQSPEIKTIIQEIVDRGGWASGNAMMFQVCDDLGSGTNNVYSVFYDNDSALAAKLYIEYYVGAGPSVVIIRRRRGG